MDFVFVDLFTECAANRLQEIDIRTIRKELLMYLELTLHIRQFSWPVSVTGLQCELEWSTSGSTSTCGSIQATCHRGHAGATIWELFCRVFLSQTCPFQFAVSQWNLNEFDWNRLGLAIGYRSSIFAILSLLSEWRDVKSGNCQFVMFFT